MPAVPPQVNYQRGQLTILAQNSTLGDILRAVHRQTGADIDVPANATERVVTRLGPGPAREVLASLLNGSHFNYVMVGSVANPSALERVLLVQKPAGAADANPANQSQTGGEVQTVYQRTPQVQPQVRGEVVQEAQPDMETDNSENVEETDQGEAQPENQGEGETPNGQPAVKTPEQLLQELQRQQQLQQQLQQQQGQPQGGFPLNQPPNRPDSPESPHQ